MFCAGPAKGKIMADEAQYSQIIAHVFAKHYTRGAREVVFDREEIVEAAQKLGLP